MNKPHVHAELIKAWADGAEIQVLISTRDDWLDCKLPNWATENTYRVKPREFPKTSLLANLLYDEGFGKSRYRTTSDEASCLKIANAAIKQYILDQENVSTS